MIEYREPMSPGGNYQEFMDRSVSCSRLSKQEEFDLINEWRISHNQRDFNRVYLANTKLVYTLAKLYKQVPVSKEDLIQEGMVGLAESIKSIDTSIGVPLGVYAAQWIKTAMRNYIIKNKFIVRTALTNEQKKLFFKLPKYLPINKRITDDEREEIAKKLKVKTSDVKEMESRFKTTELSVNHTEPSNDFLLNRIESITVVDTSEGPEDTVLGNMEYAKQKIRFKKRLYKLSKQQRELIEKRYLIDEDEKKPPHKDFAKDFGVTRERVRQIEVKAFERMRSLFKNEKY